jgi:MEMO1 family protein
MLFRMGGPVRRAAVAGSWYPGEPRALAAAVERDLAAAGAPRAEGDLVALISPHAGMMYSGPVAAHGYSLLRGRSELSVVLVGPSHRAAFHGVAAVTRGAFETPLGPIPIDEGLADAIVAGGEAVVSDAPHRLEHSLEMQLPYIQHVVHGLRIVPLLMGTQSREETASLAAALSRALAARPALLVASSDLSHYEPRTVARVLDARVVARIEGLDPEGLMDLLEAEPNHACGGGPIVAVMTAARALGANRASVLRYADSGEVGERDTSRVVGYLSAALTRSAS